MNTSTEQTSICLALKEYGQVGPKMFQNLMMVYGEPSNIFDHTPEEISSMVDINMERAGKIAAAGTRLAEAEETIDYYQTLNVSTISFLDHDYPDSLRNIPDPPIVIYTRGDIDTLNYSGIAVVGTTAATQEGIRAAVDFTNAFIEHDKAIVSGLAMGIDASAHLAAIKSAGRTIAVLPGGVINIYPEENEPLAKLITDSGVLISEYDIHATAVKGRLVSRNRLIAGLAKAVFIVQVGEKRRGELHAGQAAIDQGKPVFIYDPYDQYSKEELLNNLVIKIKSIEQIDEIISYIV